MILVHVLALLEEPQRKGIKDHICNQQTNFLLLQWSCQSTEGRQKDTVVIWFYEADHTHCADQQESTKVTDLAFCVPPLCWYAADGAECAWVYIPDCPSANLSVCVIETWRGRIEIRPPLVGWVTRRGRVGHGDVYLARVSSVSLSRRFLPLTHSLTHRFSRSHSPYHSPTFIFTPSRVHSLTITCSVTYSHTQSPAPSLTHALRHHHTLTKSLTHSFTHNQTLTLSPTPLLTYNHTLTLSPPPTHSLTHIYTPNPIIIPSPLSFIHLTTQNQLLIISSKLPTAVKGRGGEEEGKGEGMCTRGTYNNWHYHQVYCKGRQEREGRDVCAGRTEGNSQLEPEGLRNPVLRTKYEEGCLVWVGIFVPGLLIPPKLRQDVYYLR